MAKLLVNAPDGVQKVIEVSDGGGYFDASLVIWDERIDGPLPEITEGGMVRDGALLVFDAARKAETDAAIAALSVPKSVTRFQALAALEQAGLLGQVEEIMGDPQTPAITRLAFNNALSFERTSPTVATLAAALNLTGYQVDTLFIAADGIEA